jgi:hypothetical protein
LLPDPERRLEDYGRFFFDELLRYHSRASFAHTHPWRLPSPRRCCADTPSCVGPHLPCLSLVRVLRIGGSALIDLGLLRQNYGAAAAPSPHPRRTLAAPSPHPRRTLAASVLPPRCTLVVAGNHWLLRSSAILGPASKADVLLEHEGWPTQRDHSEGEQALLASMIYNFTVNPSVTARRTCTNGLDEIRCCLSKLRWAVSPCTIRRRQTSRLPYAHSSRRVASPVAPDCATCAWLPLTHSLTLNLALGLSLTLTLNLALT